MERELLWVVALTIVVVIGVLWVLRLFRPLRITLTVGPGRRITVGGTPFPSKGPATDHESFVVPVSAVTQTPDEIVLSIGKSDGEEPAQSVGLSRRRLRTLHIDAALESEVVVDGGYERPRIVVYGGYERPRMLFISNAVTDGQIRCIWCRGGIIVCGINPQCK